jgi:toxin ParE1/3/4
LGVVRYSLPSRRDLESIRRYIAADNRDRAQALTRRIRARCRDLGALPTQGRLRDDAPFSFEVRSVAVYPYVVFYRIVPGGVQILRVIDGRRDLGTIFFE